jgi:hypothetical protein
MSEYWALTKELTSLLGSHFRTWTPLLPKHFTYSKYLASKYFHELQFGESLWGVFHNDWILFFIRSSFKIFQDFAGLIYWNSMVRFTEIATVNKEMYTDILHRLRDAVRRKGHEKCRAKSWFLLHDNAPAHWSVLVKDFLTQNNVTTSKLPSYSPDVFPDDLYLFSWLTSTFNGRRFCGAASIINNATEELKMLTAWGTACVHGERERERERETRSCV